MNLDALLPQMPSQCRVCKGWFELNDMDSCLQCSPEVMCARCHKEHMTDHEIEDREESDDD